MAKDKKEETPKPADRMVKSGTVKVRAVGYIAEEINGQMQTFAPGAEFDIDKERRKALGPLVEDVK